MLMSPVLAAAASIGVGPRRLAGRCWMSPGWSKKTLAPPAASASTASPIQASRRGRRAIAGFSVNGYLISILLLCAHLPRMLDLHLELGILRAPPERLDGPGRVGNQLRRISGPSRYHVRGNSTPGYPCRGFQHVFNGCPSAGSEVEPVGSSPLFQEPQRADVCVGKIRHMNVIPDPGSVRSRVVSTINRHRRALPKRGAKNQRNQVRLRIMVLADLSVRIRTRRVEVS